MKKIFVLTIITLGLSTQAQTTSPLYKDSLQMQWVDSTYQTMTMEQKIGQLFVVAAYSNQDSAHENQIMNLIQKEHIGGLIFMQDNATKQVQLTNKYQKASKIPLLIGMDAEWDLAMRLKNTNKFPWAMTTGAVQDNDLLFQMGEHIADHIKRVGAQFNFGPVVDVNINPANPVIGNRSFGSDANNVGQKGWAYAKGMQDHFVLASAKHFPGHGDTSSDSHKTLPTVSHDRATLDKIDLAPYKKMIQEGVTGIMIAHLSVPALEPNSKLPASLSKKIVTDLLKNELGFKGLIVTDALNMKGVTNSFPNGETDLRAFEAGNDILLFSQAVATGKAKIKKAIETETISEERLEESVKKILMAKYFSGLNNLEAISTEGLSNDLNDDYSKALTHSIFENAVTLLKNADNILPIQNLDGKKFGFVALEGNESEPFLSYLRKYATIDKLNPNSSTDMAKLSEYDYVFIGVHKSNASPYKSYKVSAASQNIIKKISAKTHAIVSVFSSPYALKNMDVSNVSGLIVAYQNHQDAMMAVPQAIFGAIPFKGKLPVDVNKTFKAGDCIETQSLNRLGYALPENVGVRTSTLTHIDELAEYAMKIGATPGMQILAARNGKVFLDKTYGYTDSKKKQKVAWDNLYDVASITKVVATLPLLIEQIDKGQLSIEQTVSQILPSATFTNKGNITIKEILAHQGGLYPWIPFYKETMNQEDLELLSSIYSTTPKDGYVQVAKDIYIKKSYQETMLQQIYDKENVAKKYRYSDLGYYLFKFYLENNYKKGLDELVQTHIYQPMGMNYTTYNPLDKFPLEQIIPTENDLIFRKQYVHGYVHDQGAAMLGGVGGHAGIFSNSNDLAKMIQMYLNGGEYGGKRYLSEATLQSFSQFQYPKNRRGLGFDKQRDDEGPTCGCVDASGFGHTGFTGTMVWVDPEQQIIYVFLSNRVNPNAENRTLIRQDIRENIQQTIYDALIYRY